MGGEKPCGAHIYLFSLGTRASAREFMCLSECVAATRFLPLSQSFDLAVDSEMASKWPAATFPRRPVVPDSLSSTSKPTRNGTYNQKKIK